MTQPLFGAGIPKVFLAFCLLAASGLAQGQGQTLEKFGDLPVEQVNPSFSPRGTVTFGAYTSVQVNVNGNNQNILNDAANEPSITVDPTNPDVIVIGWRQFDNIASSFREAGWAYSHDGGTNWTFPGVLEQGVFRSDPVLDSDNQGNLYYLSLGVTATFQCDVFVSSDGGISWNGPFFAYGGDKSWFMVDRSGSTGDGNLYQSWNIAGNSYFPNIFNRSTSGGLTWSNPSLIPDWPVFGTLDVTSDGVLYVCGTPGQDFNRISISRSTDARFGVASPTFQTVDVNLAGDVSLFGGPNPGGLLGQIWVAADRSNGPTEGNVYMLASLDPNGPDPMDVHFIRSTDAGLTWSNPIRINDDPTGANRWQWFGTMSVGPNGRIDVVWNDTRSSLQDNVSELYYAYSMDGGFIWSDNIQVSPSFDSHLGWPNQAKIGDYYDMVSDAEGGHLAYSATFNGEQDVYYLKVFPDCNNNSNPDFLDIQSGFSDDENTNGIPDECELILTQGALIRGQQTQFQTRGFLAPGETVIFAYSTTGTGSGPCIFNGQLCIDLLSPVQIGSAVVGQDGVASLTAAVPPNAPLIQVYTQAAMERGVGSVDSIKSNVVTDTIQ